MTGLALVVLCHNSAQTLARCLESAREIADSMLVVDSGSTDESVQIATRAGARVLQHPFLGYSDQRNWAAAQIEGDAAWLLHLDSDEYLTPELAAEMAVRVRDAGPLLAGFIARRRVRFLGREIRHGGIRDTWHLRLYRTGRGRCEDRRYDQHFVTDGPTERLRGFLIDDNQASLERWTELHNRWSTAEAQETIAPTSGGVAVAARLMGSPINRKRWLKDRVWKRLPPLWRAFAYFSYRYFLRLGFLDGQPGLIFHTLQGFWFRFLVDSKVYETRMRRSEYHPTVRA